MMRGRRASEVEDEEEENDRERDEGGSVGVVGVARGGNVTVD